MNSGRLTRISTLDARDQVDETMSGSGQMGRRRDDIYGPIYWSAGAICALSLG